MTELFRRLSYLLHRRRNDRELAGELEFHREMAARRGGVPLGNALHWREQSRDAWGWTWLERLGQDLRFAFRTMRRSPGFTAAAVLMLAIGIGANVAVFSFFDLIVLRPLNVRDPATLLRFHRRGVTHYAFAVPFPEAEFLRRNARTLSAFIAVNTTALSVEGEDRPLNVSFVSSNYFRELGGTPALGRVFDVADENAGPVVILSHAYWQRRFGGDPSVVGRALHFNGRPAVIVGVARANFGGLGQGISDASIWAPIVSQPLFAPDSRLLTDMSFEAPGVQLWGRIAAGQSPQSVEAELQALAAELKREYPDFIFEGERLASEPGGFAISMFAGGRRGTGPEHRDPVVAVFALAGSLTLLILAVACGNLGSMLLARGVARQREIAIRSAIGAGSARLIRQLFTESLLLAAMGAAAGLGLGTLVLRALLSAAESPAWLDASPDWRVTALALGAGLVSAILFGLTPALQTGRPARRPGIARQVLVAAQVAASCVLLIVAGLLGRALSHVANHHPGFEIQRVVSVNPGLAQGGYTPARARTYLQTLVPRLLAIPGTQSVGLSTTPPLGNVSVTVKLEIDSRPFSIALNRVDGNFFETMRIPLLRGRNLREGESRAVVIDEYLAHQAWPAADALGKTLPFDGGYTVVGICSNVASIKLGEPDKPQVYLPIGEADLRDAVLLVRGNVAGSALAGPVATTVRAMDARLAPETQPLSAKLRLRLEGAEYIAMAAGALGLIAQLLACLGIFGVVAYAVSQRTRDIGIRMALGARPLQVVGVVLGQFALPVSIGLAAGFAGATAFSQFLRGRLFGISHLDPAAYLSAIALFLVTATVAALLPARRALRVDPVTALRCE